MTSLLLFFSFILHILSLLAIFQLFKQVQTLKKADPKDVMELLETYLLEIREENRVLQEELSKDSTQKDQETPTFASEQEQPIASEKSQLSTIEPADKRNLEETNVQDNYEMSTQARILQLYKLGYKADEIAQQLNCGKTEAELIIKIHANNQ